MPIYYHLHDGVRFQRTAAVLTAAWRQRSFAPCLALRDELRPAIDAFLDSHRVSGDEIILFRAIEGLPFDRNCWRLLVGEVLLYGAEQVPELQSAPETLGRLLDGDVRERPPRDQMTAIEQAHYGARDLVLGGYYRPDSTGINGIHDVARLAAFLAGCDPLPWMVGDLRHWPEDERADELEFARQSLRALQELYAGATARGQVIICETI